MMETTELDQQAEELRKIKRDVRRANRIIKATQGDDADHYGSGTTPGPDFETVGRDLGSVARSHPKAAAGARQLPGNEPGAGEEFGGQRQPGRRPGGDHAGISASSAATTPTVGRLEAAEQPLRPDRPEAKFDRPDLATILAGDPTISARKLGDKLGISHEKARQLKREYEEAHPKERPAFFKQGKTLSKEECEELYQPFIDSLEDIFDGIDRWLWTRQKNAGKDDGEAPIWSNFSEKEYQRLTKLALKHGQKNELVAEGVRMTTEAGDYVAVAGMIAPRFIESVEIYRQTKKPRLSRRERREGAHATPDQQQEL